MGRIADYVIGILAEILDEEPEREKTYEWALGDCSLKTGRRRRLPFDACWESSKLIVEVDENQHREAVPFWDKPTKLTVSGVHRGEQRKKYDKDKRASARLQGYRVIELPWDRRPVPSKRDREADKSLLVEILAAHPNS